MFAHAHTLRKHMYSTRGSHDIVVHLRVIFSYKAMDVSTDIGWELAELISVFERNFLLFVLSSHVYISVHRRHGLFTRQISPSCISHMVFAVSFVQSKHSWRPVCYSLYTALAVRFTQLLCILNDNEVLWIFSSISGFKITHNQRLLKPLSNC